MNVRVNCGNCETQFPLDDFENKKKDIRDYLIKRDCESDINIVFEYEKNNGQDTDFWVSNIKFIKNTKCEVVKLTKRERAELIFSEIERVFKCYNEGIEYKRAIDTCITELIKKHKAIKIEKLERKIKEKILVKDCLIQISNSGSFIAFNSNGFQSKIEEIRKMIKDSDTIKVEYLSNIKFYENKKLETINEYKISKSVGVVFVPEEPSNYIDYEVGELETILELKDWILNDLKK